MQNTEFNCLCIIQSTSAILKIYAKYVSSKAWGKMQRRLTTIIECSTGSSHSSRSFDVAAFNSYKVSSSLDPFNRAYYRLELKYHAKCHIHIMAKPGFKTNYI